MRHRLVLLLVPVILAAAPAAKNRPAPTGLKILSAPVLEPATELGGRPVAVTVQNLTDKTIVAVAALFEEFRADGTHTYTEPENFARGVGMDWDGPNSAELDPSHHAWIRPGQVTNLRLYATGNSETASVKVTITGIVYDDRTSEGSQAEMLFHGRREDGQRAREAARQEKSPSKRALLEKQAEWYETHAVEVER